MCNTKTAPNLDCFIKVFSDLSILTVLLEYIDLKHLPIMLALFQHNVSAYYAQNYAGIIGASLFLLQNFHSENPLVVNLPNYNSPKFTLDEIIASSHSVARVICINVVCMYKTSIDNSLSNEGSTRCVHELH